MDVAVIMSTYNGEQFIKEQLNSIINQQGVITHVFIRDDGSKDSTKKIIREYINDGFNITLIEGNNIGVGNSFMSLLYSIPLEYDYYCFSDQDDIWQENKLHEAISLICNSVIPTLYASNQTLLNNVDGSLELRYNTPPNYSYKQILNQNMLSGCTFVWNKELQYLLKNPQRRPSSLLLNKRIHDVWVAMVAATCGIIVYDEHSYIYYRQHSDNVVGVRQTNVIKMWMNKLLNPGLRNGRSDLCKEVERCFKDVIRTPEVLKDITLYANYNQTIHNKFLLLRDSSVYSQTKETVFGFWIKVLLNLF